MQVATDMLHVVILGCNFCNGFKKHVVIWGGGGEGGQLEMVSNISAIVAQCNFSFSLSGNGVTRQVAGRLQLVTCSLCNLSPIKILINKLEKLLPIDLTK